MSLLAKIKIRGYWEIVIRPANFVEQRVANVPDLCGIARSKRVARMIREHQHGIVDGMALRATNTVAESVNARIQKIKPAACGFRSRDRFRNAILFHVGGLDL